MHIPQYFSENMDVMDNYEAALCELQYEHGGLLHVCMLTTEYQSNQNLFMDLCGFVSGTSLLQIFYDSKCTSHSHLHWPLSRTNVDW